MSQSCIVLVISSKMTDIYLVQITFHSAPADVHWGCIKQLSRESPFGFWKWFGEGMWLKKRFP